MGVILQKEYGKIKRISKSNELIKSSPFYKIVNSSKGNSKFF